MRVDFKECWICGKPAEYSIGFDYENSLIDESQGFIDSDYLRQSLVECEGRRGFCKECYDRYIENHDKEVTEYLKLKKHLMFERAVRLLERQDLDIYEYKELIDDIEHEIEEHPELFDSSQEIIAAIILADNEIPFKMQYKVGPYRLDFLIRKLKVVLEVDGIFHELKIKKDNKRDDYVRKALGEEWEIIRIGSEYLNENATLLVEAIKTLYKEKKKIRRMYGEIPSWYNKKAPKND